MQQHGLKAILFGIQLVLIGGLLMFGLGPLLLLGMQAGFGGAGPGSTLVYLAPLPGLVLVIAGGIIGARGYLRDD